MIEDKRDIKIKGKYDVIVVGGGVAGIAAAVSASRNKMSVLLIEKQINLGGLATSGLISWYEPLCDGKGNKIIGGIAEELIKLSARYSFDNLPKVWGGDEKNERRNGRYSTFFSPTVFSLALDEYVIENGVKLRFDTYAVYPVMENNVCRGVICESATGREFFEGKIVIDATGDASVLARADIPTVIGENYMTYIAHMYDKNMADELHKTGDVRRFRRWINAGSDMFGKGHPDGLRMLKGDSADDITDYVIYGKKRLLEKCKKFSKNDYDIMTIPTMPQFRTVRRIVGAEDFVAERNKYYENSIGACGDFRPDGAGKRYEIPYGALYNADFSNILACGRIISSPQGDGWEVARVIPVCAMTGEAAGNAAALVVKNNCHIKDIDIFELQRMQENNGVKIHI